ncbi:hypothetical protein [Azospirillum agricola]|uniref:hypothetical protein n=1 Tax=Azospirillum agricola TaxID=1720247 RepID=UPI001177E5B9|nr:hypothetical protein [Azospirillum agricola]
MPHPLPLLRRAPCEAARPDRCHRAADGGRRPVQERCVHHRPAGPFHHAARPAVAPAPAPHPPSLWREMMGRWLPDRDR